MLSEDWLPIEQAPKYLCELLGYRFQGTDNYFIIIWDEKREQWADASNGDWVEPTHFQYLTHPKGAHPAPRRCSICEELCCVCAAGVLEVFR